MRDQNDVILVDATDVGPLLVQNSNHPEGDVLDADRFVERVGRLKQATDKRLTDDPTFSALGITATVLDQKVTLLGTVKSQDLKDQVERMVKQIKGVKSVDNQITVL